MLIRIPTLALFATVYKEAMLTICAMHWIVMFLWVTWLKWDSAKSPGTRKCSSISILARPICPEPKQTFRNFIAASFLTFCFVKPVKSSSTKSQSIIYFLVFGLETVIMLPLWSYSNFGLLYGIGFFAVLLPLGLALLVRTVVIDGGFNH